MSKQYKCNDCGVPCFLTIASGGDSDIPVSCPLSLSGEFVRWGVYEPPNQVNSTGLSRICPHCKQDTEKHGPCPCVEGR